MKGEKKSFIILICMVALLYLGLSEAVAWNVEVTNAVPVNSKLNVKVTVEVYVDTLNPNSTYSTLFFFPQNVYTFHVGGLNCPSCISGEIQTPSGWKKLMPSNCLGNEVKWADGYGCTACC